MSRATQRADRIRAEVPILRVLEAYGYHVRSDLEIEQQFQCDLHGDGRDNKPSARVYPDSGKFYCFACQRARDVISLVREKEGKEFWDAVKLLELRYNLPTLPWEQDDDKEIPDEISPSVEATLHPTRTFEEERGRLEVLLTSVTHDRDLPQNTILAFWEGFDRVCYGFHAEHWPDVKAQAGLSTLRGRLMEQIAAQAES